MGGRVDLYICFILNIFSTNGLLLESMCGDYRDLGSPINIHPWIGIMEYEPRSNRRSVECTCTLISKTYAITAANCLTTSLPKSVRFGDFNVWNEEEDCARNICADPPRSVSIRNITTHPGFNPTTLDNDVALLRFRTEVAFSDFVQPICLASFEFSSYEQRRMRHLVVAGYGSNESPGGSAERRAAHIAHVECRRKRKLCAGDGIWDACRGDSGGPLVFKNDADLYELIGVQSASPQPCTSSFSAAPALYSSVFHYLDWIESQIKPYY